LYIITQHLRVVVALVIREMQSRFGTKPGGYAWAIVDPLAHVATMTIIFSAFARTPAIGKDFGLFFASGYLPFTFYQGMSTFIAGAIRANKNLFSYPVISPFDAMVARYILQFVTSVAVTIVVMLLCTTEGGSLSQLNLGMAIEAAISASLIGMGIGMINVSLFEKFPLYENIFGIINRPMFMVSGVFMLPDSMPGPIHQTLMWNPLVHVVMWFRQAIYPEYMAYGIDKLYVLKCVCLVLATGLCLFSLSRKLREDRL